MRSRMSFCDLLELPPLAMFQIPRARTMATAIMPIIDTKYNILKFLFTNISGYRAQNQNTHVPTDVL